MGVGSGPQEGHTDPEQVKKIQVPFTFTQPFDPLSNPFVEEDLQETRLG